MMDINGDGEITADELKEVFKTHTDSQSQTIAEII